MRKSVAPKLEAPAEDSGTHLPAVITEDIGYVRRVKLILAVVLCVSFALSMVVRTDAVRQRLLLLQASLSGDPYEQIQLYQDSLYLGAGLDTQKKLVTAYEEAGSLAEAGHLAESLLLQYPDDPWLNEFKEARTPAPPLVSVTAGTYDDNVELEFSTADSGSTGWASEILCFQDGEQITERVTTLSDNGTYHFTLQTRNGFGFQSEPEEYTYVIDKLIPQAVEADTASGYYGNTIQVALFQPEGFPIYYTLDGSEPDESAALYQGPITVESGRVVLRAAARSPQGVIGEQCRFWYQIRPWSSGLWNACGSLITAHGDYFLQSGVLVRYVDGEAQEGGISLPSGDVAVCEFNDGFLVAKKTSISYFSLETQTSQDFASAPGDVKAMEAVGEELFVITNTDRLYRLSDGIFEEMPARAYCIALAQDQSALYLGQKDGISILPVAGGQASMVVETPEKVTSLAVGGGCLFYAVEHQGAFQYNLSSGETVLLEEYLNETYRTEPHLITDGYLEVIVISHDNVCFANGQAYFSENEAYSNSTIPWSMPSTTKDPITSQNTFWFTCTPGSGEAKGLTSDKIQVGNGYYRVPSSGAVVAQN